MNTHHASPQASTLTVTVNDRRRELTAPASVATLLEELSFPKRTVAVAVNHKVVPKASHDEHWLADGDTVDIVQAVGGG